MANISARQKLLKEVRLLLGEGMVDVELDQEHYELAFDMALDRYRTRSQNAMEESFLFLDVQPEVSTYTLPDEVQEVRDLYRRNIGGTMGGGSTIDPFGLAYTNAMYQIGTGGSGGGSGGLANYEMAMQNQELIGRMFGRDVQFTWNTATKKFFVQRKFGANEEVCLHVYNTKPEEVLLADPYARQWLRDWTQAKAKFMLATAYAKFGQLAGPQGGITLNGAEQKQEAVAEMERLENELHWLVDGHEGYTFIIG